MSVGQVVERVRRPEYTGENRCVPCTVVNLLIGGVAAVALGALWPPAGVLAGLLALAAIYLRGYLVPGTPTITKRLLPERVLAWFGKDGEPDRDPAVTVESRLLALGAVEECADRDDLCLTASFRETWRAAIEDCRDVASTGGDAATLVGADPAELELGAAEDGESQTFLASRDGDTLASWPSRAAYVADIAAARVLAERDPGWETHDIETRNATLNSLRLFLEWCPDCDGAVELGEEEVDYCCGSVTVAAVECTDCGARVFEARASDL
jgi:hypothetical protein